MRLTRQDIKNIDIWLKRKGIKYVDVRFELIDHLTSEYEEFDNYPDLGSFLENRLTWCKKVTKQKQRSLGLGQFKITGKEFFRLLVYPKTWLLGFLFL